MKSKRTQKHSLVAQIALYFAQGQDESAQLINIGEHVLTKPLGERECKVGN